MRELARDLLERIRRFAMPAGPVRGGGTWIRQQGEMRLGPDRPWMRFEAEQWFEGEGINFRWKARVRMAPLVRASVVDAFWDGTGSLTARIFRVIPVARARGPETDKGEALRGLAELPWRPFAFREGPPFTWEATAPAKLRAIYDGGRTRATLDFDVDAEGCIRGAAAANRPRVVGRSAKDTAWSGAFREYRMFDGLRVPTEAEVTWHLPDGPFTYWRGRVLELRVLR